MVLILYQAPLAWLQHVWLQDVLAQPVGFFTHLQLLKSLGFDLWADRERSKIKRDRDEQIDVIRVSKNKENKQARDRHVLRLLTCLRAVFPGNVTESIGRQILPYTRYDVVPDELQLKQPVKLKKTVQYEKKKVQCDRKIKLSRKHQAPFQRR